MHILIATPYLPWPLNAGGKVAQFSTLECLANDHTFTIVCPINSQEEDKYAKELEQRLPHVRVKGVPFYKVPTLPSFYSQFRVLIRRVLAAIRQPFIKSKPDLKENIIQRPYYPFSLLSDSFITVIAEELEKNIDILQVEFAEMLTLAALKLPDTPKIFINHQIHWVYAKRHLEIHGSDAYSNYLLDRIYSEESLLISNFDSIIVFSEADAKELSTAVSKEKIYISPFPVPADIDIALTISPLSGNTFTFIGSEAHGPNRDAMEWLLSDILPLIRASIPQAQLFVVGSWSESWCSTHQTEGIIYTGFVENLDKVMKGTIQLVPVRIGSGIRTKILAAMAQGVPVVSTTIGIEGIKVQDLEHALIRDSAKEFALGAITLAQDPILANRLAKRALEFIANNHTYEVVRETRNKIYESVKQNKVSLKLS